MTTFIKRYISYFALFLFFGVFFNTLSSCTDKCKDKICSHGYCIKGDCFCEDGYSGENCEIKESDKFAGFYRGKMECDGLVQNGTSLLINNDFDNPREIAMNLKNSNNSIRIRAHVRKDSLFIYNQFFEKIDTIVVGEKEYYDTTLLLIYPSGGVLKNDSILDFDLKIKGDSYIDCKLNMLKQ